MAAYMPQAGPITFVPGRAGARESVTLGPGRPGTGIHRPNDGLEGHDRATRARLVAAQEAERARIARDLHDVVGQALTLVRLNLTSLAHVNAWTGASGAELVESAEFLDSIAAIDEALLQVRTAAFDLRPALLDDVGLSPALRALCRQVAQRSGLAISCLVTLGDVRLSAEVETTCFRVAQEAITNAVRHADARRLRVRVGLRPRTGVLVLDVSDDGVGFDPTRCTGATCVGIAGMAERAALVDGAVEVRAGIGDGTRVIARFPVGRPVIVR